MLLCWPEAELPPCELFGELVEFKLLVLELDLVDWGFRELELLSIVLVFPKAPAGEPLVDVPDIPELPCEPEERDRSGLVWSVREPWPNDVDCWPCGSDVEVELPCAPRLVEGWAEVSVE
jgi:hypothetical protein